MNPKIIVIEFIAHTAEAMLELEDMVRATDWAYTWHYKYGGKRVETRKDRIVMEYAITRPKWDAFWNWNFLARANDEYNRRKIPGWYLEEIEMKVTERDA